MVWIEKLKKKNVKIGYKLIIHQLYGYICYITHLYNLLKNNN